MTLRDALSIAIPALALFAVLAVPGELRWAHRPSFITGLPRRTPIAIFFAALLGVAIVHTIT